MTRRASTKIHTQKVRGICVHESKAEMSERSEESQAVGMPHRVVNEADEVH